MNKKYIYPLIILLTAPLAHGIEMNNPFYIGNNTPKDLIVRIGFPWGTVPTVAYPHGHQAKYCPSNTSAFDPFCATPSKPITIKSGQIKRVLWQDIAPSQAIFLNNVDCDQQSYAECISSGGASLIDSHEAFIEWSEHTPSGPRILGHALDSQWKVDATTEPAESRFRVNSNCGSFNPCSVLFRKCSIDFSP